MRYRGGVIPVGRMAPTPSGHLHLGNALAFGAAWLSVRSVGGRLLLRIEDLDVGRARPEIAEGQREDLQWLGLFWDQEVTPQSQRTYSLQGIPTYLCDCNRAARRARACRCRGANKERGAIRFATPPGAVEFADRALGRLRLAPEDDPVLVGADGRPAYNLAVVIDDARDGVTEVVRGADLVAATPAQIRLYETLGLAPPTYLHTPVLLGPDGKKLSKSHGSTEIRALRAAGWTATRVWETLLPLLGLPPGPITAALAAFDPARILPGPFVVSDDGRVLGSAAS